MGNRRLVFGSRWPVEVVKDAGGVRTVKGYVFRVGLRCGFCAIQLNIYTSLVFPDLC